MRNDFSPSGTVCLNKRKIRYRLGLSVCFTASVLAGSLLFVAATIAGKVSRGENLADAAQQLLTGIHETHYQHKTYVVESAGIYDMDCSGFVDFLLKRVAPERYADLPIEPGHARPRAAIYFDLLSGLRRHDLPGWKAIDRLADAQRGDIIAWELEAATQRPGDTGHVVIVAGSPVLAGAVEYQVAVYDSSGIHHDDDSRPKETSGIGKGVILFQVDDRGAPVAFRFNSHAHLHLEPIAIGRIVH
jgi:hypothetical protein